jgi:serine/threonine protein kinase
MADENTGAESATRAEPTGAGSCSSCGRPLTPLGPNGECLRCLFDWGAICEEEQSQQNAGVPPGPLRYGHFEVETDINGFPIALGAGAMAVTYRARDTVLNSLVALKVISLKLAENPIARARFLREARAAAQIHHPNVARVTHYGEQDGEYFYAMELVEGETLQARVQRTGPLPLSLALEVIEQATRGLAAAEACGVVHRDLKPSNLMIASDASELLLVKIIDYGVAKVVVSQTDTMDQTQAGFIGTPAFASPEQFAETGKPRIDTRSDIYSLGVTLWYLLTGHGPFRGETLEQIRSTREELPLEQLKAVHVPVKVIALLKSILAVDPAKRPQTARELLAVVHHCREKFEPRARVRRKRLILAAAGSALLFAALVVAMFLHQRAQSLAEVERSIAVLPFENLSPSGEDAYFTVGMQDEIADGLARLANLKVIGRGSTRSYLPGKKRNLPGIARDLGVRHLLEGSVTRANDVVRISLRLIDSRDSDHPWTGTYEQPIRDVFALENEITRSVAARLRTQLSAREKSALNQPPTRDAEAYELYLRARDSPLSFRDEASARRDALRRIDLLEKAVARDSRFLLAYCELAKAHGFFFSNQTGAKPEELVVDHRSLAEIALQNARSIDPDAGELHLAQAYHFFRVTKDYQQAGSEADLARRTLPNNFELEMTAARVARSQGRWDDAVRGFERAIALEPRVDNSAFVVAETYRLMRRYEDYNHLITQMIASDPAHPGDLPLEGALGPLEQRADPGPLRVALAERAAANDLTEHDKILTGLTLALSDHDAETILRILEATDLARITNTGVAYPKAWFQALAERLRGNKSASQAAFLIARADIENAVAADPGNGRKLGVLAIIDAGLEHHESALAEALRAREQMKNSATDAPIGDCNLAIVYAWTGQRDRAITSLEPLIGRPAGRNVLAQPTYGDFKLNLLWDPLRDDPRFQALVQRLAPPGSKQ